VIVVTLKSDRRESRERSIWQRRLFVEVCGCVRKKGRQFSSLTVNRAFHGGSVIFVVLFTAHLLQGDVMTNQDCIEALARVLDVEMSEAHRLLNGFSSAMVAELLACGKLSIKGLGMFTVKHLPPVKKSTDSGSVYTPPCNKLQFDSRISGGDDTARIAVSRVAMSRGDAARFAQSLASFLGEAVQQQREILLNGFGRFFFEERLCRFEPDLSLESILNRDYQDLHEVVVSSSHRAVSGSKRKYSPYILFFSAVVLALVGLAALYGRQIADIVSPSTLTFTEPVVAPVIPKVAVTAPRVKDVPHPAPPVKSSDENSVVLDKDDFTVVLATFHSEETALHEVRSMRLKGIISFVWPASLEGVKYYRITAGKFSNRPAAVRYLKGIPAKTAGSAYIQHVTKRVVLHGKNKL
jgi:nucleoid DNA-binding protein